MKETLSIPEFWRVFALFFMLMKGVSIATMSGSYLILYWVFSGSMLEGAFYLAMLQSFAYILAIGSIPLITWICNKYQKHNALRFAIFMLICNAFATWFAYKPGYPMLMFILPFFGSVGISSMYTVMGTLMADVTDVDELRNGVRREGMFGAVNAMIMKALAPLGAIMTSIVIIMSGFDIDNGANQAEGVFLNMRLILVFLPLIFLGIALLLLYKYPLTRDRMMEIKGILAERRKKAKDK